MGAGGSRRPVEELAPAERGSQLLLEGRTTPNVLRGPRVRRLGYLIVEVTDKDLRFLAPAHPFRPRLLHAIPFETTQKLSLTYYGARACLLTLTRGTGVVLVFLRECVFTASLGVGSRSSHAGHTTRRRGSNQALHRMPGNVVIYYNEPSIDCVMCRHTHKLSEVSPAPASPPRQGTTSSSSCGSSNCVICLEAPVSLHFSRCGHACVCRACLRAYLKSKGIKPPKEFDDVDDQDAEQDASGSDFDDDLFLAMQPEPGADAVGGY